MEHQTRSDHTPAPIARHHRRNPPAARPPAAYQRNTTPPAAPPTPPDSADKPARPFPLASTCIALAGYATLTVANALYLTGTVGIAAVTAWALTSTLLIAAQVIAQHTYRRAGFR